MKIAEHQALRKRLLLVEDERVTRKAIRISLSDAGYEVVEANDGVEAIEILANSRFDAVITDVLMRPVNGTEVIRYLRSLSSETPIIVMTGNTPSIAAISAFPNVEVVEKPLSIENLESRISFALSKTRPHVN